MSDSKTTVDKNKLLEDIKELNLLKLVLDNCIATTRAEQLLLEEDYDEYNTVENAVQSICEARDYVERTITYIEGVIK